MRRFLKLCLSCTWLCTRCVLTFILWSAWLAMAVALVFQVVVATNKQLSLPFWIRTQIEHQLTEIGLDASLGQTLFDPSGRILIHDAVLKHHSLHEPLLNVHSLYVRIDPWWLLVGQIEPLEIEVDGATFFLPSLLSPTGKSEAVLSDVSLCLRADGSTIHLPSLSARLANLEVTLQGAFRLPLAKAGSQPEQIVPKVNAAIRNYLIAARKVVSSSHELERFESPRLHIDLFPRDRTVADASCHFTVSRLVLPEAWTAKLGGQVTVTDLTVKSRVPLGAVKPVDIAAEISAARIDAPASRSADRIRASLRGVLAPKTFAFAPTSLRGSVTDIKVAPWFVSYATFETPLPSLAPTLTAIVADEPWKVSVSDLDLSQRHATVAIKGVVSPLLINLVGDLIKRPLSEELQLASSPRLEAQAAFEGGWKLKTVTGRLSVDAVTARTVDLDAASAEFSFAGTSLAFTEITLKQGTSFASGSYTMDTKSLDYRFLLGGRLQPPAIGGWFRDWWPRFWENFDFSASTPLASVDVSGRWGAPDTLTVFVAAENERTAIRGTQFDRARARIFVRPHFYDVLHFNVIQAERHARGTFSRKVDLESREWSSMDFEAFSNLDLAEGARVLAIEGLGIVEPFRFAEPPQLRLTGHLDGPASPLGEHRSVDLAVYSTGQCYYYDFPLRDLSVIGKIKDADIVLDPFTTGFAGGTAEGRVHLTGEGPSRRLGFDFRLTRSVLGEAIKTLEEYGAKKEKAAPTTESRFQQRIASGRLDLAVSADGIFNDIFSYQGQGNAQLTGADLGEVHLFGLLSQALNHTLFDFSTMKLDTVQTNFTVEGPKLAFSEIRITGPRAAIDAKGDYNLSRKTLDMKAKLFPFDESQFLLSSAVGFVLTPLSQAFEFKLTGPLDKPNWSFVYGPSNFFRSLIGGNDKPDEPVPSPLK